MPKISGRPLLGWVGETPQNNHSAVTRARWLEAESSESLNRALKPKSLEHDHTKRSTCGPMTTSATLGSRSAGIWIFTIGNDHIRALTRGPRTKPILVACR